MYIIVIYITWQNLPKPQLRFWFPQRITHIECFRKPTLRGCGRTSAGTSTLGFLRQSNELRHDDSGIEHSEQRCE